MREWAVWIVGAALVTLSIFFFGAAPPNDSPHAVIMLDMYPDGADEYFFVLNNGEQPVDLSGWTLFGRPRYEFTFPDDCRLNPGKQLIVHTGPEALKYSRTCAEDGSGGHLQWGPQYVWCNSNGNTALLYDEEERLADKYVWGNGWHRSAFVPCNREG